MEVKKMKRITASLICALMVFCLLPATAMAADTWDGTSVDTSWYNTTDTEFTIYTGAELAGLAQIVNSGDAANGAPYNLSGVTITLGDDIDLGGHQWTPIGYYDNSIGHAGYQFFDGTLDGGGHTISGLAIGTPGSPENSLYMVGLFGETTSNSSLKNLNVETIGIYSSYNNAYVGVLAAFADKRVSNCTATGDVTGGDNACVGGLAGSSAGDMTNCHASGNVTGGVGSSAGGLLGDKADGALTGCYATGNVTGGYSVGGLVGNGGMGTISDCYATGNVMCSSYYAGGFIGYFDNNTSVSGCYATGNVTASGTGVNAGGFAGFSRGTADNCYAAGSVSDGNHDNCMIGGFIGNNYKDIQDSYARGAVSGGGTGTYVGEFAGRNQSGATLGDCYFDTRDAGLTAGIGQDSNSQTVTGLAPDEMTGTAASTNMAGLDFSVAWTAKANDSEWYFPQLTVFAGSSDNTVKAFSLESVTLMPFTVTFESNGGGAVAPGYGYYTAVGKPADPTRSGHLFEGWYTTSDFTTAYDFTTTVTADITLYAKWTAYAQWTAALTLSSSDSDGTIYTSGRVTLTPNVDGGTWDWDHSFFTATFNSSATFTALKAGTSTITYTMDGVSVTYDVTIKESTLPSTGQDATLVTIFAALGVLALAAGIIIGIRRHAHSL